MSRVLASVMATAIALGSALPLSGCERERRRFDAPPMPGGGIAATVMSSIHPGPSASAASSAAPNAAAGATAGATAHEGNAYDVAQGKRLYRWFNCNGCHAAGGGAIGPALMDDQWLYGHEPAQIVATLMQGRPNGMPSFAGRISEQQAWQLAAYVRSMSGQLREDVAPSRSDGLSTGAPELRRDKETPKRAAPP
jgi:cytochrome c oxidase cbb3-type subunit 3